ncbi:hypothetical protein [Ancylomarina euxinus]|nr:hypothetical protein [Ancylomarina euxinus]MCZ4693521.1 hypothetical protein [Ancylomarina euxinus]MUP13748.1 hypothetical protein [Ancylomarina euxinus]
MYKNILVIVALTLMGYSTSFAQLSTRENSENKYSLGTRPQKGNLGIYLGTGFKQTKKWIDEDISVEQLPLINFKYYLKDQFVLRLGVKYFKNQEDINGDVEIGDIAQMIGNKNESEFFLTPGFEKHFSNSNLVDVYIGAELPFGRNTNSIEFAERYSTNGDFRKQEQTKSSFVYGFNFFTGVQFFIADLPLALGLEWGIRGLNESHLEYKTDETYSVDGEIFSQTYYSTENDIKKYKELEHKKFNIESDFAVSISYFFKW